MRILTKLQEDVYNCQSRGLTHLGRLFRLKMHLSESVSDLDAGKHLLR